MTAGRVARELVTKATSAAMVLAIALPLSAQAPRPLTITRDLKIDATTYDFSAGLQVDVGRDGTIAVTQPQDHKIVFFDAKGALLGSIGRSGEGPGEFRDLGNHGWYADTFWVLDVSARRTSLIAPQQKFLRTVPWPVALKLSPTDSAGLPAYGGLAPYAVISGGRIITTLGKLTTVPRPSWYPADQSGLPIVVASATGMFQKLLGFTPTGETCAIVISGTGTIGRPFCAPQLSTFSRDGSWIGMVQQATATGTTGEFHVTVLGTSGDTAFRKTFRYTTTAITRHISDSVIEASIKLMGGYTGSLRPQLADAMRSAKIPASYAPVKRLIVGRDGTVWLEMQSLKAENSWRVLTAKGEVIGDLTVPNNVSLAAVSRSAAWGIERDQDDLQSVVRYKVGP